MFEKSVKEKSHRKLSRYDTIKYGFIRIKGNEEVLDFKKRRLSD